MIRIISLLAILAVGLVVAGVPGGTGEVKNADEQVQKLVDSVSSQIAAKAGISANSKLIAVSYKTQVVAGTNYFVKIRVGVSRNAKVIHVRIYKDLKGKVSVSSIKNAKESDPVNYFD
ncbi:cystatin-A2-like [Paramacrobiotus metropolitanus]|uniref:cystatin-A2-like n=1 Tax=Paramacrobiotus metropolitanus TaxID=2943436 RepID=UPI0024461FCA|nr:cystatin-A2-like [Paramacrobiotus metropolitanus]